MKLSGELAQIKRDDVRRELAGRVFYDLRVLDQTREQCQFRVQRERRRLRRPQFATVAAPLLVDAANPGVRILHIVDRVVGALRLGQIKIEIEMLVALAQDVKKTRRIVAYFLPQLAQRHEFAGACRHRHLLAAAIERRELYQRDGEPLGIEAEGCDRAFHARDIAVMVGAPHVDHEVEPALKLVEVVGDVGREIGVLAVFAL